MEGNTIEPLISLMMVMMLGMVVPMLGEET
jgi:hypothetical protein